MRWRSEAGGIGKILLFIIGGIVLIAIIASVSGGGDGGDSSAQRSDDGGNGEVAQTVNIPGEATLDASGRKSKTAVLGVQLKDEAIPGNEFTRAPEGKTYMIAQLEITNVGDKDLDLNSTGYRMKLPAGEIIDYVPTMGNSPNELQIIGSTLIPGAKKTGTLTWEVPKPAPGQQYTILWKPSPFDESQAQFVWTA